LRKHLLPRFGNSRLRDIRRAEIQQCLISKLQQGFAWETTNHLRNVMSKIFTTAISWDYLRDHPVRGVIMPERQLKHPHLFLTMEESRRLIDACDEPARTLVLLAVMTGLRIGELMALRWSRIDFSAATLRVVETCSDGHFGTPKTKASRREIPLSTLAADALLAHHARCPDVSPMALVFATRKKTAHLSSNLRRRQLQPACARAGLPKITWHSLRHTHGTLLHHLGTPLKVAQAQLGHSEMSTTLEVYTHSSSTAQRQAVDQLQSHLFPNVPNFRPNTRVTRG